MLCQLCSKIPLDLFLPTRGCGHSYHGGAAWLGSIRHSGLEDVEKSSAAGCVMCRLIVQALETDKTVESIPAYQRPDETYVALRVIGEGLLRITEQTDWFTVRTGNLYWFNEGMKQGRLPEHSVHNSPSSPGVFSLARSWIETCRREHKACSVRRAPENLPTRLIDIGLGPSEECIRPHLINTKDYLSEGGHDYVALSHCWGTTSGGQVPRTVEANLIQRTDGIKWDEMSKTFQDAFTITRGLGLRYVWIDSLCIIQDVEEDFLVECAKMGSVYANAYCTLAASDSPNGDGGCFIPRDNTTIGGTTVLCQNKFTEIGPKNLMSPEFGRFPNNPASSSIKVYQDYGPFLDAIKGPLSARGWTLQERELSPRILHYTKDQVLWECRECIASEVRPYMEPKDKSHLKRDHTHSARDSSQDYSVSESSNCSHGTQPTEAAAEWRFLDNTSSASASGATLQKWYALVETYSRRQLTVKRDKLPAISGIAAEVSHTRPTDTYVAGLWKNDLLRGLAWYPDPVLRRRVQKGEWPPPKPDEAIPSWSWAAFDGPITHYGQQMLKAQKTMGARNGRAEWMWMALPPVGRVIGVQTQLAGLDPFGRVSGGKLWLSGWAIEISVSEEQFEADFRGSAFRAKCYRLADSFRNPPTMRIYFDADPEDLPSTMVVCLQLGSGKSVRQTGGDVGLVLMPMESSQGVVYRRVGMFDVESVDRKWKTLRAERTVCIE